MSRITNIHSYLQSFPKEAFKLKKEASKEKQAQDKNQSVNYDFDKTHEILYPNNCESGKGQRANNYFSSEFI